MSLIDMEKELEDKLTNWLTDTTELLKEMVSRIGKEAVKDKPEEKSD